MVSTSELQKTKGTVNKRTHSQTTIPATTCFISEDESFWNLMEKAVFDIINCIIIKTILKSTDMCVQFLHKLTARALIRDYEDGSLDTSEAEHEVCFCLTQAVKPAQFRHADSGHARLRTFSHFHRGRKQS